MGKVVHLTEYDHGVVQVTMEDRATGNMFSPDFIRDFTECFDYIREHHDYKVVVLTGYDNYFASGGTRQELEDVFNGTINFNELGFFKAALDCDLPVISAMQGHGIGGGFVLGLYADIIMLGRENYYTCNFMKYGFTPGVGATYIVPYKLGNALGHEMLLTAKNYQGAELEKRGVPFEVFPKKDVLSRALETALEMAEHPKVSLLTLKEYLAKQPRAIIGQVIEEELAMHDITFKQPVVMERINQLFNQNNR